MKHTIHLGMSYLQRDGLKAVWPACVVGSKENCRQDRAARENRLPTRSKSVENGTSVCCGISAKTAVENISPVAFQFQPFFPICSGSLDSHRRT